MDIFKMKLLMLPGILLAFVINGFATAYTSDKLGDPSPRSMGKLNLSPFTYIDLFGFILILLCGFGWTKPVFTDSRYYKHPKRDTILVALSGTLGNFLLAFICLLLCKILGLFIASNNFMSPLLDILRYAASVNISLGFFYLIPIPPLNGFKILEALIGYKYYNVLQFLHQYGFFILILLLFTNIMNIIIGIPATILYFFMDLITSVMIAFPMTFFKTIK